MEKGDVLKFRQPKKGTRVYMAVAGGMHFVNNLSGNIVLKAGTRIELERDYNELHKKMFDNLEHQKCATWESMPIRSRDFIIQMYFILSVQQHSILYQENS